MEVFNPTIIKTQLTEIWLDEEGIIRVKAIEEGEIDIDEAILCFDAYKQLGCDKKKAPQLMDFTVSVIISKEAREYVDKMAPHYFSASAVVTQSLPVRIIVNFCMKFFNPVIELKMFNTEKEALKWLRTFKTENP